MTNITYLCWECYRIWHQVFKPQGIRNELPLPVKFSMNSIQGEPWLLPSQPLGFSISTTRMVFVYNSMATPYTGGCSHLMCNYCASIIAATVSSCWHFVHWWVSPVWWDINLVRKSSVIFSPSLCSAFSLWVPHTILKHTYVHGTSMTKLYMSREQWQNTVYKMFLMQIYLHPNAKHKLFLLSGTLVTTFRFWHLIPHLFTVTKLSSFGTRAIFGHQKVKCWWNSITLMCYFLPLADLQKKCESSSFTYLY